MLLEWLVHAACQSCDDVERESLDDLVAICQPKLQSGSEVACIPDKGLARACINMGL